METTKEHLIAVRIHESHKGPVLAACDFDLLDKEFKEGDIRILASKDFYLEKTLGREEFLELLSDFFCANLIGKKTIDAYCSVFPGHEPSILYIGGIPHLQIYSL